MTFAFPQDQHTPTCMSDSCGVSAISRFILPELSCPEGNSTLRDVGVPAVRMTVPEAPMNENGEAVLWENDVGPAWEVFAV
jgi:hypothetical protein